MDANHLSKRLAAVAKRVPDQARLADIGSDHAYLPVFLAKQHRIQWAIAGEVVAGPFENARSEIVSQGLTEQIEARLGDGLAVINPQDQLDTIVIAGMGGTLISDILTRGWQKLSGSERLILQPNVGEAHLRQWLVQHQYRITSEEILKDEGHIYEIIMAVKMAAPVHLTDQQIQFGPQLLAQPNTAFVEKWQHELARRQRVLASLKQAHHVPAEKVTMLTETIASIKEVLAHARTKVN
ncbi:tRNA (adenine(22)-N(1))-methyltransferase [Furfurilactobacillus curtus]|uniref:SAM-dependent methyltransferase n=1 Tax=Furfurilactobacillus curtus TaxID=1746200 RepID=A0ABQ5JLU3_9LACO